MGCGASKKEILEECEKPLCSKMEKIDIEEIDEFFNKNSIKITEVEEIRKILIDVLMDHYFATGAWAYKKPDVFKALECGIWRLGVDNGGKPEEIGFNENDKIFEGSNNSLEGNKIINDYINNIDNNFENINDDEMEYYLRKLIEDVEFYNKNYEKFLSEINEKFSSDKIKVLKKQNFLKSNFQKTQNALICLKELIKIWDEIKSLQKKCEKFFLEKEYLNERDKIEKAFQTKKKTNIEIVWNVIEKEDRRCGDLKDAIKEYKLKLDARNAILLKINN